MYYNDNKAKQLNKRSQKMTAQTARTTILTTPAFKAMLKEKANKKEISVSELIKQSFEKKPTDEELVLEALTLQLNESTRRAEKSLEKGLNDVHKVLAEIRSKKQ
jgi:predicted DNA-binding ribbon-helix-helix protein